MNFVWASELSDNLYKLDKNLKMRKLTEVDNNQNVKFNDFLNSSNESFRMAEMGFTSNSAIKVIRNDGKNPIIIETKNVKLMIARKIAESIFVE